MAFSTRFISTCSIICRSIIGSGISEDKSVSKSHPMGHEEMIGQQQHACDDLIDVGQRELWVVLLGKIKELANDALHPAQPSSIDARYSS